MANPTVYSYPVPRPDFAISATWSGGDEDLSLDIGYKDVNGITRSHSFTTNGEEKGTICLPTSTDVADLGPDGTDAQGPVRDILAGHLRMCCFLGGTAVPGSQEFSSAWTTGQETNHLQTAIGTVKISADPIVVSDVCIHIEFRKGTGTKRIYEFSHIELNTYTFEPETQVQCLAGYIEKQFPSYVHDYDPDTQTGTTLSQAEKDDIKHSIMRTGDYASGGSKEGQGWVPWV